MQITSDQIRAARALLRLDQAEVARRAGVSAVTLRRLEAGRAPAADTLAGIAGVLEQAGVEFVERGVRKRARDPEDARRRYEAIKAIVARSAPALTAEPPLADADLYDERGLPK